MKTIEVIQGSDDWLALRGRYRAASEAPAMMGASNKISRQELLRLKASGGEREFSEWVRRELLEKGHEIEAKARPIAEGIIGEDLYPVTAIDDDGYMLASFDGLTLVGNVGWECKSWNEEKAGAVRDEYVPSEDYWQVVQQLVVSGADRWLYMVTDGTPEKCVYLWVALGEGEAEALLAGWRQFDADVAAYQHVEAAPEPVAEVITALPALVLQVEGRVVSSNLAVFRQSAEDFIARIKTDLQTDDDFATAEKTVKFCKDAEDRLELVKKQALAQTATIDEVFRTIDSIREGLREKRLSLDKTVAKRKEAIRFEVIERGRKTMAERIAAMNAVIGKPYMPIVPMDFAAAIKGKKTVSSLNDAVDAEVSRATIAANDICQRIQLNMASLRELAADHAFLFADTPTIVLKANDDLVALIKSRIAEHKAAEEAKADAARKAEAERLGRERAAAESAASAAAQVAAQQTAAQPATYAVHAPDAAAATPESLADNGLTVRVAAPTRPTDAEIIEVLSLHFMVPVSKVVEWIVTLDITAANDLMDRGF